MIRYFDRIKETCGTPGTGDVTLLGAVSQFRAFSAVYSVGDEHIPYAIVGQSGTNWEVGIGKYSASNTLQRKQVLASSNSGSLVNFSTGTQDVFVTIPGEIMRAGLGLQLAMSRGSFLN